MKLEQRISRVKVKIEAADRQEKLEGALIVHQASIEKKALEKSGCKKVYKGRKIKPVKHFHRAAYEQGREDAKEIDLDQRAIKNQQKKQG